ncbi:Flp family type IVb pilin [Oceanicella actignis]|uniref:Flp pilus assembly protein, pilin Flp n=1 Tax=Oceanicella actignis TaxID=1189325 RepID=A0A1M7TKD7_9RHOB|nr:hypothetical protein [Oceanicella actignis]SET67772.1 hypothetical protein SAMN04488119_10793 [Oceanicella actignis]SHN71108.1 hypothetical protein SAMN05216200_10792 [Oceanicella actignis]
MMIVDCVARKTPRRFVACEKGAVTVDWVVLTAMVVVAFIFAVGPVWLGFADIVDASASEVSAYGVSLFGD